MYSDDSRLLAVQKEIQWGCRTCLYEGGCKLIEVDDDYLRLIRGTSQSREHILGNNIRSYIHPEDLGHILKDQWEEKEYDCVYRLKTETGKYIWVRDIGKVYTKEDGRKYLSSVVMDIDAKERMTREKNLAYESLPGGVIFMVVGKDNFYIRDINSKYYEMLGMSISRENYIGTMGRYTFPEDLPKLREHCVNQAAKREPLDFEFRFRREDTGAVVWCRILGNYYDQRDDGAEYLCLMIDITSRKQAQFDLIREKEKYRMGMKSTADMMFEYDVERESLNLFGHDYISEESSLCIEKTLDTNYKELIFKKELIYPGDRGKLLDFIRNQEYRYDNIRLLTKNKESGMTYFDNYEFYCHKVYEGEKIVRVVGYAKKISYKTVPMSVRQELHEIFDEHILKDYSFVLKIDVPTESFIPYFIDDSGMEDYPGNRYYDSFIHWWCRNMVLPEEQREMQFFLSLEQILRILYSGEPRGYRFCQVRQKDHTYKHKICTFSFYGSDVNVIIFAVRDVNAIRMEQDFKDRMNQKVLADALAEAKQAVEERRIFMRYLVREIQNPVMGIKELLRGEITEENRMKMIQYVDYVGEIIAGIDEYNRSAVSAGYSQNQVNLYQLCHEVCEKEREVSLGLDISIHERILIPEDGRYYVNEFRFREILENMLGNALKYAPNGSRINLIVGEERIEENRCRIYIDMEDEGPVINERFYEREVNEEYADQIMDKMLVLGSSRNSISIVAKIIGLLNGSISFEQGLIHSSVVKIEIPVYASDVRNLALEEQTAVAREDGERSVDLHGQGILLLEKENRKGMLTAPLLQVNGAKVYLASSGKDALHLLEEFNTGVITAILADRELVDMTCYEFARKCRYTKANTFRKIPIIEMVDGIRNEDVHIGLMSGINAYIYKPINFSRLVTILESFQE